MPNEKPSSEFTTEKRDEMYLYFLNRFREYIDQRIDEKDEKINFQTPQKRYCNSNPGFGKSTLKVRVFHSIEDSIDIDNIECRISFRKNRDFYSYLEINKDEIEKDLGSKAIWEKHLSSDSILVIKDVEDVFATDKQQEHFEWLANKAILFQEVFGKYYQKYQER